MSLTRRRWLGAATAGIAVSVLGWRPGRASEGVTSAVLPREVRLTIGAAPVNITGLRRTALTVNGGMPAPLLRWREGDEVVIHVRNLLAEPTSIHWHGILLPANMDGVPGLSFDGIPAGGSFTYRFTLCQSGTYWYHSHSLFQEQQGLYGALIVDPRNDQARNWQREHVLVLSDWTDLDPAALFRRLKKMPSHDNWYKRTAGDLIDDVRTHGVRATLAERRMWNTMRMTPTDLSDVNAHTYTYLLNGRCTQQPWTGLFAAGERVLLRFINASAMTYFDVRIPGLKMTVVAADGQPVHPVSVDEFRIAVAETFDVLVEPAGADAFTVFAQDMGRTGSVAGTLLCREGLAAPVPALDPRPLLGMREMGHGDAGGHRHAGHHRMPANSRTISHPATETGSPLVDMQVSQAAPRLDDPGVGLRDNGRSVLTYGALQSRFDDPDPREPGRELELHLTGHMEKFAWSFNGEPFVRAEPLRLRYGERLRVVLVNDTMMHHPIHLHGLWSDLEDEAGGFLVRKHTIDMPPATRRTYRVSAAAPGRWAYHCHLLYHMESGMMREVRVED